MKKILWIGIATLVLSGCVTVVAVPRGAVFLGERVVAFRGNYGAIPVGRDEGFFHSLYFVVERNNIELSNFVITYGNGERERFATRLVFGPGSRSREFAVAGGRRIIRSIAFAYRTIGSWSDERARVVVYGVR